MVACTACSIVQLQGLGVWCNSIRVHVHPQVQGMQMEMGRVTSSKQSCSKQQPAAMPASNLLLQGVEPAGRIPVALQGFAAAPSSQAAAAGWAAAQMPHILADNTALSSAAWHAGEAHSLSAAVVGLAAKASRVSPRAHVGLFRCDAQGCSCLCTKEARSAIQCL